MSTRHTRRHFIQAVGAGSLFLFTRRLASARAPATQPDAIARISDLAAKSPIADYRWKNRGKSPPGYIKGMAVSFAKISCELRAGDDAATEMAKTATADASKDALKHYEENFQQSGMDNSRDGEDTLRHLFVLMLGLGMRESSGRYCEGRDRSAHNTSAETAEAGLFQTSFNARVATPLLPRIFHDFRANPEPSYLNVFKEGVRVRDGDLENYGSGDGREFQKMSKECPFFALKFTAVGLRNLLRHWGPINRRDAEIRPDADTLFKDVWKLVESEKLGPLL